MKYTMTLHGHSWPLECPCCGGQEYINRTDELVANADSVEWNAMLGRIFLRCTECGHTEAPWAANLKEVVQ